MTRTYNTSGLVRGGPIKPRVCTCCGETKKTSDFTHNPRRKIYTPHCRLCGVWLTLLREVFGPVRDWDKNRQATLERCRRAALVKRRAPVADLLSVWR